MAKTDLVPCFYKEQDAAREQPAKLLPRHAVHELKAQKLGAFILHGRAFRLFQSVAHAIAHGLWDGPFGTGNLLPFFKRQNPLMAPPKLHYEIPKVGECRSVCSARFGWRRTKNKKQFTTRTLHVSGRKLDFPALLAELRA